jgi:hypothetical protein
MTDLLDNMLTQYTADVRTSPFTPPVIDRTCDCGAAAVAMVYQWRPGCRSSSVPKCRDCRAVTS